MEYDSALSKKAENSDTCDNMDEPWRHYASEPSQSPKHAVWFHLQEVSRIVKFQKNKVEWQLPGAGGGGMGSCCLMGIDFQFGKMEKLWRLAAQ